jgi:hypothetical protein
MATFMVSAFWHGFYPSYYFCFFFAAFLSEVTKDIFKSQILFHKFIPKFARLPIAHVSTMFVMNYVGVVFTATTWTNLTIFLKATYCLPWVLMMAVFAYSRATNMVGRAKKLEAKLADKKKE